ncbi:MAG: imidazole glycerol phosphate synthase subunit HisH [Bacteroidales bacterium]|nr:imidazole glycerol phosphate synthase subunit HisH [Bacteroidales bacterium]
MKIAILKYNAGNIMSVQFALKRLGYNSEVTDNESIIRNSDRVIFPGVGEAATTMDYLRQRGLDKLLKELNQPVLGICLGLQLMCSHSEEGNTNCIGIFDVPVLKFLPSLNVPHMGWNTLENMKGILFEKLTPLPYVYFVHSYYAALSENTAASCKYINEFSASLQKDNFFATQFHPEKSGDTGHLILQNFIEKS